jgi:YVTN family beta-propeller protein
LIFDEALKLQGKVAVGEHPFAVAFSPDGRRILALNVLSNDVSVIDTSSQKVIATIAVGRAPYGVAFSDDGERAYVTNQHAASVSVIDLRSLRVRATWPTAEYPEGIAVHGDRVLVVSWMEDAVCVLDAADGRERGRLAVGSNPRGFGQMLWR